MSTANATGILASDQTGKSPRISNRGIRYLFVLYIYNAIAIKVIPIKIRRKEELLRAYKEMYEYFTQRVFKPHLHKIDNETSKDVEKFITEQQTKYQYTPPDMQRNNPAERAIQTYKSCTKSIFANPTSYLPYRVLVSTNPKNKSLCQHHTSVQTKSTPI